MANANLNRSIGIAIALRISQYHLKPGLHAHPHQRHADPHSDPCLASEPLWKGLVLVHIFFIAGDDERVLYFIKNRQARR